MIYNIKRKQALKKTRRGVTVDMDGGAVVDIVIY